jgi:ubiquinone/menaquinone biosynthesis C-methylase UbiE
MVTVDVEAQPRRAEKDHIDRLIWGRFPNERAGIDEMMRISDRHGVKMTLFLDYCEEHLYGDALLDVGREILRSGHDLQLHAHLDFLSKEFWSAHAISRNVNLNRLEPDQAAAAFDFICDRHQFVAGAPPRAFRGGGYRYNAAVLDALVQRGVRLDSSVNVARGHHQPVSLPHSSQYLWSNGCLEVPVSCVEPFRKLGRCVPFNFNESAVNSADRMAEFLDDFYEQRGNDAIAVLVMHSWSFLKLDGRGFFSQVVPELVAKYDAFLDKIARKVEIVTASDVLALSDKSAIKLDAEREVSILTIVTNGAAPEIAANGQDASATNGPPAGEPVCPICGSPKGQFTAMNGRACPGCGSVERQRCFAVAYDAAIQDEFDLTGRKVLIVGPSGSELRFMKDRGLAGHTSVDVRPETKPDIVGDICRLPAVATNSQDFIYTSYLMPVVHDPEAALDELARMLAPGGRFISVEPVEFGKPTVENTDPKVITGWYGQQNLEKYRVGSFRQLGDADYLAMLQKRFDVKSFTAHDPVTGQKNIVHLCRKRQSSTADAAARTFPPLAAEKPAGIDLTCTLCGAVLSGLSPRNEGCPSCGSRARTRTLPALLANEIVPRLVESRAVAKPALAFAMDQAEERALRPRFADIVSISTYDNYRAGHISGVRLDGLTRFADQLFSAFFGLACFDYVPEMEAALAECARVVDDGGVFFTTIMPYRLKDDASPPTIQYRIEQGPGNFESAGKEAQIFSVAVGRKWFVEALDRAGFDARHVVLKDEASGVDVDWFIGVRRGRGARSEAAGTGIPCDICGFDLASLPKGEVNCPQCSARPRSRTIVPLMHEHVRTLIGSHSEIAKPLLSFAMVETEEKALKAVFSSFLSASLYGNYRTGHQEGVDVRDLSRYQPASFIGAFGSLLFDYFEEHDQALAELARVIVPGGILFTHIAPYRLTPDDAPPKDTGAIKKRPGYFDYVPNDANMPSIKVGVNWFMQALERAGFAAQHVAIVDRHSGETIDWFIGIRKSEAKQAPQLEVSVATESDQGPAAFPRLATAGRPQPSADALSKEYSVPLQLSGKQGRLVVRLSIPAVPKELQSADFAEHVYDPRTGGMTDTVIVCGRGMIGVSEDLGVSWRIVREPATAGVRLINSFTTADGNHLIQALGWQGPQDKEPATSHGRIFVFDRNWKLLHQARAGEASWHGTASVGQSGRTIMYGEYFNNSQRYAADFEAKKEEYLKVLRPNGVFRSTDEGATWRKVLEFGPMEIRHFHTVVPDPYEPRTWWASSGDTSKECRVWRSRDDGDSWSDVTNEAPDVPLPASHLPYRQSVHRYTDVIVGKDDLLWGADDILGPLDAVSPDLALADRTGARLYVSPKGDRLMPREIGFIGNPVRKLVDVGDGWMVMTEAKEARLGLRPGVFFIRRDDLSVTRLFEVDNYIHRYTGFTYSKGSRAARNGTFFTFRLATDALQAEARILKWDVGFEA